MNKEHTLQHYSLVYPVYKFPVDQIFVLLGLQKTGKWEGYLNGFGGQVQAPERYHACARLRTPFMAEIVGDTANQCIPVYPQLDGVGTALVLQDVFSPVFCVVDTCDHYYSISSK